MICNSAVVRVLKGREQDFFKDVIFPPSSKKCAHFVRFSTLLHQFFNGSHWHHGKIFSGRVRSTCCSKLKDANAPVETVLTTALCKNTLDWFSAEQNDQYFKWNLKWYLTNWWSQFWDLIWKNRKKWDWKKWFNNLLMDHYRTLFWNTKIVIGVLSVLVIVCKQDTFRCHSTPWRCSHSPD